MVKPKAKIPQPIILWAISILINLSIIFLLGYLAGKDSATKEFLKAFDSAAKDLSPSYDQN